MSELLRSSFLLAILLIVFLVVVWYAIDMRQTFKHDIELLTEMLDTLKRLEARDKIEH